MSRTDSYHKMLQATAQIQMNIALILEAKALEAVRSHQWICKHLNSSHFDEHSGHVKKNVEIHEQLLEVIDGITKMEQAMAKNLTVLLSKNEDSDDGSSGSDFGADALMGATPNGTV